MSSLDIDHLPSGSMTLSVAIVPAPAALPLLALAALAARRRR
jgi:MYXO-CTERM domain-containing protein